MKKEGRVVLTCTKKLPNGITERFTAVTFANKVSEVKKNYESQGYRVTM